MRVVPMRDIIYVLEMHYETSEVAGVVLDLLDYVVEVEDIDDRGNH